MSSENPNQNEIQGAEVPVIEQPIDQPTITGEVVGIETVETVPENAVIDSEDIVPEPPQKSTESINANETQQVQNIMDSFESLYGEKAEVFDTPEGIENPSELNSAEAKNEESTDVSAPAPQEALSTEAQAVLENAEETINTATSSEEKSTEGATSVNGDEKSETLETEEVPPTVTGSEEVVEEVVKPENQTENLENARENTENGVEDVKEEDYEILNEENKNYLETGLAQKGKRFFSGLYEKLDRIPVINKLAGKMAIAYNEKFAKINEKSTNEISGKISESDQKLKQFAEIEHQLKTVLAQLEGDNLPGTEKIRTSLRRIENKRKKEESRNKESRGKLAEKIESYKSFINERNRIADGLIDFYEKKMLPVKEKLDELNKEQNRLGAVGLAQEIRSDTHRLKIDELEKKKNSIIEVLKKAQMTDKEIEKFAAIKSINSAIERINKDIEKKDKELEKKINKISRKIDSKNNKYKKVEEKKITFDKIKLGEQIDFSELEDKSKEKFDIKEVIIDTSDDNESSVEKDRRSLDKFAKLWNLYVAKVSDKENSIPFIDTADLMKTLEITQPQSFSVDQFCKIMKAFYEYNSIPAEIIDEKIKGFKELISNTAQ